MIAPDSDYQTRLSYSVRALGLLLAGGVSLGFALGIAILPLSIARYFQQNLLPTNFRNILLACMIGGGAVAVLAGGAYLFINVARPKVAARLYHVARRLAPLYLVGFLSLLFRCETWKGRDLPFLILRWARFVGWPVVAVLMLLTIQSKSSQGLRQALGNDIVLPRSPSV